MSGRNGESFRIRDRLRAGAVRRHQRIRRTDQGLLGLNLLLLLGVTFLPFPTAVVAQHIRSADARLAAMFYNGVFIDIAICWGVLWRYASHHRRLLGDDVDEGSVRGI